jgi:hypothetical protein
MAKGDWWFKFDFRVWRSDSELRECSLETKGFWVELLCAMYEKDVYEITGSHERLARLLGCSTNEVARCVIELRQTNTANVTDGHGEITIKSRRLERELNARESSKLRKRKQRSHGDVTPQSKSNKKKEEKREEKKRANAQPRKVPETQEQWLETLKQEPVYAHVDFEREFRKAEIWIADHPGRKLTKLFFKGWINKIEPPLKTIAKKPEMSQEEIDGRATLLASREAFYGR